MKDSVPILFAMKEVTLEANKCFHTLWPVASYSDEQRGVAMAIPELNKVGEGRWFFYLVRKDWAELTDHTSESVVIVGYRMHKGWTALLVYNTKVSFEFGIHF